MASSLPAAAEVLVSIDEIAEAAAADADAPPVAATDLDGLEVAGAVADVLVGRLVHVGALAAADVGHHLGAAAALAAAACDQARAAARAATRAATNHARAGEHGADGEL